MTKNRFILFITGFVQVYFVSVNTCFLANGVFVGVLIAAFLISLIWSFNVRKVVFGKLTDRIIYSLGASLGSYIGLLSSGWIMAIIEQITNK